MSNVFQGPWAPSSSPSAANGSANGGSGPQDYGTGAAPAGYADVVGMRQAQGQGPSASGVPPQGFTAQAQTAPPQPQTGPVTRQPVQTPQGPVTVGAVAQTVWGQAKQMPWWVWFGLGVGAAVAYNEYAPKAKGWAIGKAFGSSVKSE